MVSLATRPRAGGVLRQIGGAKPSVGRFQPLRSRDWSGCVGKEKTHMLSPNEIVPSQMLDDAQLW